MDFILELLLLGAGFLSLVPVLILFNTPKDMKYKCLKFLVNATFVWTILIFIEQLVRNYEIVYYAHMLGYPLKFLMASFMFCTIFNYMEIKLPKPTFFIVFGLFFVELVIALTNPQTRFMLDLIPSEVVGLHSIYEASNGILFLFHVILTYSILLCSITTLVIFLSKRRNIRHYQSVTRIMVYSVIIVLGFNMIQILFLDTTVDLTYISLVIVTFMLYRVIYSKDMIFNLKTSGRGEILSNMREIYILTDYDKRVVEISSLLQSKYNIDNSMFEGKPLDFLLEELKKDIVVYTDYDIDNSKDDNNKDHYHLREKKFTLNKMNEHGFIVLLYDETQVFSLLRELNQLSNYDNMTGLHNRNYLETKIQVYKEVEKVGIISLDLNGLKTNNDYLGHERGDYLLKKLSNNMKSVMSMHENSEMARIGGDEFLIIVDNSNKEQLEVIRTELLNICSSDDIVERVSVSIGIALGDENSLNMYDLIQAADVDMYRMKQKTSKEYSKEVVLYARQNDKFIR